MVILPGQANWRSIWELFPWVACIAINLSIWAAVMMDVYNRREIAEQ